MFIVSSILINCNCCISLEIDLIVALSMELSFGLSCGLSCGLSSGLSFGLSCGLSKHHDRKIHTDGILILIFRVASQAK